MQMPWWAGSQNQKAYDSPSNSLIAGGPGTYSSPIANVGARFGTMVGGLTTGRMLIGQGAIDASKIGEPLADLHTIWTSTLQP